MEGINCFLLMAFCLSGVVIKEAFSGKLDGSSSRHHGHQDLSSETILLRDKLNLILDAESREVNLLKNLLDEEQEAEEEEDASTTTTTTTTTTRVPPTEKVKVSGVVSSSDSGSSLEYLREHGIVTKLEENSKRMEKMVVFLVDLRNLLTEALTQQNRQMGVESELVEMREEMEYLRKELQSVKKEQHEAKQQQQSSSFRADEGIVSPSSSSAASLENQLHNEHTTLEWLKSSTHELRSQIAELSDQCNATLLMSLREKLDGEAKRRDENLAQSEKQVDMLRLSQLRQQEEIKEAKENIKDLRSWQVKMGNKMVAQMNTGAEINSLEEGMDTASQEEQRFITEELKDAVGKPNLRHHQNNKRLKLKVHQLQQLIDSLTQSNKVHERRLAKLENSQRTLKSLISAASSLRRGARMQRSTSTLSSQKSLQSLKKTMQEYVLTLEQLNDKVSGMDELQESTTQLFQSLEQLEKKYDDRVGEIQTGLARLESGVSGVLVTNEDLKEQQTQQSSVIQSVKKDLFQVKGKLQTNHLRLAAVQSQMVKWASTKCSDENSESIQNIRIATLEHALLDGNSNNNNSNEDEPAENEMMSKKR